MSGARMCYAVSMRIRRLNHSAYQVQYHIVFATKYRRKIIKEYVKEELIKSFFKTLKKYPDWYLFEINTGLDHVHFLIKFPPKYSASEVIQKLKSYASVDLRKKFKYIRQIYSDGKMWSTGYFVSTVGLNEKIIRQYIKTQDKFELGEALKLENSHE
jgi:putative transposase